MRARIWRSGWLRTVGALAAAGALLALSGCVVYPAYPHYAWRPYGPYYYR